MKIHDNILSTIGNTPVVRLNRLGPENVNLYVKIESFNPMSSVKDRLALGIIEDAEKSGALKPGQTVIEATSGNTGIGLAMVCAQKGYPLVVTMAASFSIERRKLMRFPRCPGGVDAGTDERQWHGAESARTRRKERLVHDAPVRKRVQCQHALKNNRPGDHRGLCWHEPRLLGNGLWHRRHPEGRWPRAARTISRHQNCRL